MSDVFRIISVNGDTVTIEADGFTANADHVVFSKDGQDFAWFNPDSMLGFIRGERSECK